MKTLTVLAGTLAAEYTGMMAEWLTVNGLGIAAWAALQYTLTHRGK